MHYYLLTQGTAKDKLNKGTNTKLRTSIDKRIRNYQITFAFIIVMSLATIPVYTLWDKSSDFIIAYLIVGYGGVGIILQVIATKFLCLLKNYLYDLYKQKKVFILNIQPSLTLV